MKFIEEMSDDKLRGGFYTPPALVTECYARLKELIGRGRLHILEPSAGDGAFVRGCATITRDSGLPAPLFTCVEIEPVEASKCTEALRSTRVRGEVVCDSFFAWARQNTPVFDAVVGNPPFVRYQFVSKKQRSDADQLFAERGKQFDGVANLWIPFLLISAEMLRDGGAFAVVLPSELFATKSAGLVRLELVRRFERLRVDLYPRGHFPNILQDVIVLSGRKVQGDASIRPVVFVEHGAGGERRWSHDIPATTDSWTKFLLSGDELSAFRAASELPLMRRLRDVASIGVSIVTGANDFFTVDDETVRKYQLQPWAKPLLAKTADAPGLVFTATDLEAARCSGRRTWILDFAAGAPDPLSFPKARAYLQEGTRQELPGRYKCRIREPWFRVPDVRSDELMMSKRAHQFHRLLLNQAGAQTTDTIYRGHMLPAFQRWRKSFVAAFHNSLTILSSEIEGRTYGGGVLELIPSELGRLVVPLVDVGRHLGTLDKTCRDGGGQLDANDGLIHATDAILVQEVPGLNDILPSLATARNHLRRRRFFG